MHNIPELNFEVQTMKIKDGRAIKSAEPDSNGVYRDVPVGALGIVSRNNSDYDIPSTLNCMTNPNMAFYKRLTEGSLAGEYGHPMVKDRSDIPRILRIDPTMVSHYILGLRSKPTDNNEYIIIYADMKCGGPYGPYLQESFADPDINTAFSLRSITSKPQRIGGVDKKKMITLVTFDAVCGPGFEQASKRYMGGMEDFCFPSNMQEVYDCAEFQEVVGAEGKDYDQLCAIFQTDKISIRNQEFELDGNILVSNREKVSTFNTIFK